MASGRDMASVFLGSMGSIGLRAPKDSKDFKDFKDPKEFKQFNKIKKLFVFLFPFTTFAADFNNGVPKLVSKTCQRGVTRHQQAVLAVQRLRSYPIT